MMIAVYRLDAAIFAIQIEQVNSEFFCFNFSNV